MMAAPEQCRYCKCTEHNPCRVPPYEEGDTCGWLHGTGRTVCTAPRCILAHQARERTRAVAARPSAKYAGWGLGAIAEDRARMRRNARQRMRRKGKR